MGLALPGFHGFVGADPNSPGKTNLEAWWTLDEASGTRVDSHGSNNLADINTVTQAAGKVGNAAQFTRANNEYLNIANNASLSMGDIDMTIVKWIYFDNLANSQNILSKWDGGATQREYRIAYEIGADRLAFRITHDLSTAVVVNANNLGSPSINTWYLTIAWHDEAANRIYIQVNNGTIDSISHSLGIANSTAPFRLGKDDGGSNFDGRGDETLVYKKVLTAAERTWLYNSGNGRTYSDL